MKIAITGHTRGIGKSLADKFKENGHEVIGFSISTGFDIGDPIAIQEILDFSLDCDIFINNAYHPTGQTILLKEIINAWEGTDKIIINICSKSALIPIKGEEGFNKVIPWMRQGWLAEYGGIKREQHKILRERFFENKPHILNVITSIVDTDMADVFECDKLNIANLGNVVSQLHIHVIARKKNDITFPKPVWGNAPALEYCGNNLTKTLEKIQKYFKNVVRKSA
jgi:hypothetical protein